MHDCVGPFAAEDGRHDVAERRRDVQEADDGDGVVVRRVREGLLHGDVQDVQGAEGYGGVVDGYGDCWEAEVVKDREGVD